MLSCSSTDLTFDWDRAAITLAAASSSLRPMTARSRSISGTVPGYCSRHRTPAPPPTQNAGALALLRAVAE